MARPPILVSLEDQAVLISRDVRAAAMEAVQNRYVAEARKIADRHGVLLLSEDLSEGWKEIWIYKHPHVGFVIERTGREPATAFDHWVLGRLFGYSEQAIADYLARLGLLTHLDELSVVAARARRESVGAVIQDDKLSVVGALVSALARLFTGGWHLFHLLSPGLKRNAIG